MGNSSKRIPLPALHSPSNRYNAVEEYINRPGFKRLKKFPEDFSEYQIALVQAYKTEVTPLGEDVLEALTLYRVPSCRAVMEGLLISGADTGYVAQVSECTKSVVESYVNLFFDSSVFKNRLLVIAYIRSLPSDTEYDKFRKKMISWGYHLGGEYIAWKIGARNSIVVKSPEESVSDVLIDASWRSREHLLSDIEDSPTRESRSWIPQVLKSAEIMKAFGSEKPVTDALKDLVFDLQGTDETLTVNDLEDIKQ